VHRVREVESSNPKGWQIVANGSPQLQYLRK